MYILTNIETCIKSRKAWTIWFSWWGAMICLWARTWCFRKKRIVNERISLENLFINFFPNGYAVFHNIFSLQVLVRFFWTNIRVRNFFSEKNPPPPENYKWQISKCGNVLNNLDKTETQLKLPFCKQKCFKTITW